MEKTERVTLEEFISRLIRHIPDEQFKTIRHYGVHSRRVKGLCKKLVTVWQKKARKWIVEAKRLLKRRNWRERVTAGTGKDPLVCTKCESYFEYKGEVCLEDGRLRVKYASCRITKHVLERMINDLTGIKETKSGEAKEKTKGVQQRNDKVNLLAMQSGRRHAAVGSTTIRQHG